MGSVVNNRLEGFTRGTDLLPGLEARVHDALWLLARQWQLGELEGTDGGTPISATFALRHTPMARWQAGTGASAPYTGDRPLEALVEEDGSGPSWRDRVAAGLRLARALRRAGLAPGRLVALHPLGIPDPAADPDVDPATHDTSAVTPAEVQAVGSVTAGRVADPDAVAAAYDANADDLVAAAGGEAARAVLADWRTWWGSRQARDAGGWDSTTLTYSMSVAVSEPSAPMYSADRFEGGSVDWYDFDATVAAAPSAVTPPGPTTVTPTPTAGTPGAGTPPPTAATSTSLQSTAIPVPVTFHGAPVARYWQMDDARTDFGAIDTFPTEIGKLLLAEFTACFAGDWYRLPVRIPYGCAVHVDALVSTDTFGAATLVPAANAASGPRPWRMFEHTASAAADGSWLLVPPVLAAGTDSAPNEEVVLVRDPAADLAWAVEHIVTNAVGRPVRRSEDLRAQGREPPPDRRAPLPDTWVWRLATSVPENWIPLLPTRGRSVTDDYELVQGAMIRYRRAPDGTLSAVPVLPAGVLLRTPLRLPEREVPREGLAVRRFRRLARWVDGTRSRWWSRATAVGHGEGSSGLAYDGLHPDTGPRALGQ
jgi:hypothetical protein